jgi:4-alpha-glucanotransferase
LYFERDRRGGFKPSERYDALALATANTHDMATLSGFWRGRDIELRQQVGLIETNEDAEKAFEEREQEKRALLRRLQNESLVEGKAGRGAMHDGSAALRGAVHKFLCNAPSVLVGLSLDDLAGEVDPVNVPGVGPDKYPSWTRRMKMSIEEMPQSGEVQEALQCGGRGMKAREAEVREEVAS